VYVPGADVNPMGCVKPIAKTLMPLLDLPGIEANSSYLPCVCNEIVGLVDRHLAVDSQPESGIWERSFTRFRRLYRQPRLYTPLSWEDLIKTRPGRTKRKFRMAQESLLSSPLHRGDYNVRSFVKVEKAQVTKLAVKAPRMIQYRTPRYTGSLARWLAPIEHWYTHRMRNTPFSKGKNQRQRAQQLHKFCEEMGAGCILVGIDQTNYDAHEGTDALRAEHNHYQKLYHGDVSELRDLLKAQLYNRGKTRHGVKYRVKATRCSGDLNTGLGNTVVNLAMLTDLMVEHGVSKNDYRIAADGDDCVLVFRASVWPQVRGWLTPSCFVPYGMEARIEFITDKLEEADYCQSRLIDFGDDIRFIRSPIRVLQRAGVCLTSLQGSGLRKWLYSVGECELACNAGVPILQSFACAMLRCSKVTTGLKNPEVVAAMRGAVHGPKAIAITQAGRLSFERAFGIGLDLQYRIEGFYDQMTTSPLLEAAVNGDYDRFDILSQWRMHVPICLPVGRIAEMRPLAKLGLPGL
jgi:hypothetical protein